MYTDWMDETVITWCNENFINKGAVKAAHEASAVLNGIQHGIHETQDLTNEIKILNSFNHDADQKKEFNSAYANIPGRWDKLYAKLNRLKKAQGLKEIKVGKDSGHSKLKKSKGQGKLSEIGEGFRAQTSFNFANSCLNRYKAGKTKHWDLTKTYLWKIQKK